MHSDVEKKETSVDTQAVMSDKDMVSEEAEVSTKSDRYYVLDLIRGICIILVVVYHCMYDYFVIFKGDYSLMGSWRMNFFRDCFVGVLIFLAGISSNLTHSNIKRGVKTFLCGMVITLVTWTVMPDSIVVFGILHFFGVAMIVYGLLQRALEKLPVIVGFLGSLLLFMLTLGLESDYFGWPGLFTMEINNVPRKNIPLFILGFNTGNGSGDYWPIIPWLFLFLAGCFVGRYFKDKKVPEWFKANPVPPLTFLGRKTLIIYLVHQPLVYGVMMFADYLGIL